MVEYYENEAALDAALKRAKTPRMKTSGSRAYYSIHA